MIMRLRWTIRELMLLVLAVSVSLTLLRVRWGLIFAVMAGGVVGCGLAPWHACRQMRKFEGELDSREHLTTSTRSVLVAQSFFLVWSAWYFAGVMVALGGVAIWWLLNLPI
jgi:hypothetical protein